MMKSNAYLKLNIIRDSILLVLLIFGCTHTAKAYTGICSPKSGTYNYNYNFGMLTVVDPKGNKPGYLFPRAYEWNLNGTYAGSCDCDPDDEDSPGHIEPDTYFSSDTQLPQGHNDGSHTFFILNDYLEVTTEVYISGNRDAFIPSPLHNESNYYSKGKVHNNHMCSTGNNWASGSKGKLWLYITKPFVGTIYIGSVKILDIYASRTLNSYGSVPMSSVWVSGVINVPQNCIIDAGQLITVDLGKIWSGDITTKGQKPAGYVNKQIKASMKCNNIAAYTNLTLRFESEVSPNYPDAIKTDNPDVGVQLFDENGKLILPNTGLMPFHIDDNYEATVSFQVAPVSTTGNVPTAGQFKALAYIRVDFA